jgi:sugar phosphate isomerase/epimerase
MFDPVLGVSLVTLAHEPTEELLRVIAASEIATLEVDARVFTEDGSRGSRIALFQECAANADLAVASVHALFGREYDLSSPDAEIRRQGIETVRDALDAAGMLGARFVVVHSSSEPIEPEDREERFGLVRSALADLTQDSRRTDVVIAVELLPRTCLGNTSEELLRLIDGLDASCFGVCLDTNHLMDRPHTLPDVVVELGERLVALHLSDYEGVDEQHVLPGKGVIDWRSFLEALESIGYDGPFNYESGFGEETVEKRIEAVVANFQWMKSLRSGRI